MYAVSGGRNQRHTCNVGDDTTSPAIATQLDDIVGKMETMATMSPYCQNAINWSPPDAAVLHQRNRLRHQMTSSSASTNYQAAAGVTAPCNYSAFSTGADGSSRTPASAVDGDLEPGKILPAHTNAVYSWSLASASTAAYLHRDPFNGRSRRPASFASAAGCFYSPAASSIAVDRRMTVRSPSGESSSGSTCSVGRTTNDASTDGNQPATGREHCIGYHWMKIIGKN